LTYNVGDKVRVNHGTNWDGVGTVYKIGRSYVSVKMETGGYAGKIGGFAFNEVEPVWAPKVGERVAVVSNEGNRMSFVGRTGIVVMEKGDGRFVVGVDGDFDRLFSASELAPAPLRIEAGKFYKTRDGRKVGPMVAGNMPDEEYDFVARIDGDDLRRIFQKDGKHGGKYIENEPANDLIAEWPAEATKPPVAAEVDTLAEEYGPSVTSKPKFKVGDRVVALVDWLGIKKGETYTVKRLECDGVYLLDVKKGYMDFEEIALVSSTTPPTTAIVCLIENGQPLPASKPFVHPDAASAQREAKRMAEVHKGQMFGAYVLAGAPAVVAKVYEHEWQRLAAANQKINAIKELRRITGMQLKPAKDAVEYWLNAA